tara:strand:- start:1941 stop:6176 length:4236 start_codon:yes stop_codon:yes gene_type:complete
MALKYSNIEQILKSKDVEHADYLKEEDSSVLKLGSHQHIGIAGSDDEVLLQVYDTDNVFLGSKRVIPNAEQYDPAKGLTINPGSDLRSLDFTLGKYICVYNVYQRQLANGQLHIHEISPSRKEIRIRPVYTRNITEDFFLEKYFHDFAIKVQNIDGIVNLFNNSGNDWIDLIDVLKLTHAYNNNDPAYAALPTHYTNHPDYPEGTSIDWTKDDYQLLFDYMINAITGNSVTQDIVTQEQMTNPFSVPFNAGNEDERLHEFKQNFNSTITKLLQGHDSVENINSKELNFFVKIADDFKLITNWSIDREAFPEFPYSIVLKLYEPLPENIVENTKIKLVQFLSNPIVEKVQLVGTEPVIQSKTYLRGPNQDIDVNFSLDRNAEYKNWNDLLSYDTTTSQNIVDNILSSSLGDYRCNIDYTDYSNFVNFSSAEERLKNFRYKMKLIENYNSQINNFSSVSGSSNNLSIFKRRRRNLISGFDGYEKFLYYESGSIISGSTEMADWPKTTSTRPYTLSEVHSTTTETWYENQKARAQAYDRLNDNSLKRTLPTYLKQDAENDEFLLFTDMVGQHFDVLFTYIKHLTDTNNRQEGLSNGLYKDFVYDVASSFGLSLNNGNDLVNLWKYTLGTNLFNEGTITVSQSVVTIVDSVFRSEFNGGTLFVANVTGSDFTSTITTPLDSYSASLSTAYNGEFSTPNYAITYDIDDSLDSSFTSNDATKEIWKRLLNNLPYLLKTKGTARSVKALISCYGIPTTILNIKEYGGPNVTGKSYYENERFLYALKYNSRNQYFELPWKDTTNSRRPDATEFRFSSEIDQQQVSLLRTKDSNWGIDLLPSSTSSLGYVAFKLSGSDGYKSITSSQLPVYDGDFWNVLLQRSNGSDATNVEQTYNLSIKKAVNDRIPFGSTISMSFTAATSASYKSAYSSSDYIVSAYSGSGNTWFSGSIQEFRIWNTTLSSSVFNSHVRAPLTYNGNNYDSFYTDLEVRLPFTKKVEHDTYPYVSNTAYITTYCSTASLSGFGSANNSYESVEVTNFFDMPNIGANRITSNKIRVESSELDGPLSRKIRSETRAHDYAPVDSPRLGVYFSPQEPINEDIITNFSGITYDDYIGDPSDQYSDSYSDLKTIRDSYFKRYAYVNNFWDYIRLIQYYDATLFDHIKSLLPVRANSVVGLVIEPHILERPKHKWKKLNPVDEQSHEDNISINERFKQVTGTKKGIEGSLGSVVSESILAPSAESPKIMTATFNEYRDYSRMNPTGSINNEIIANPIIKIARPSSVVSTGKSTIATTDYLADIETRDWTLSMTYTGSWGHGDFLFNAIYDQRLSPVHLVHSSSLAYKEVQYTSFSASEFPLVDNKGFVPVPYNESFQTYRLKFEGTKNTINTTYDKKSPVETFETSPNQLVVAQTGTGNTLKVE